MNATSTVGREKPRSLPDHWPNSTQADIDAKPKRLVNLEGNQSFWFCNNSIKTSKYEWYSFLGKFLMEEFNPMVKIANCYFILISSMQVIRPISNTGGYPTVLIPLTAVLTISGFFKCFEDMARHKADKLANSSVAQIYVHESSEFKEILWSDIKVGDYVKVMSRETAPADLIVMQVAEPEPEQPKGVCYIETKSLDGETNLKIRNVVPVLLSKVTF